jgi:uncharacterized MAPEG superfamily protein
MEYMQQYNISVLIIGLTGLMFLVQLLIADVVSIKSKQVPGTRVNEDHNDFLFRATRTYANSTETVGLFILFLLFAVLSGADAKWVNIFSVTYFIGRLSHMLFYYSNLQLLRSGAFVISLIGLIGIFTIGITTWL